MVRRGIFAILVLVLLISLGAFCIIVFGVNPYSASWQIFAFLYFSILISLISFLSIIGLYLRIYFSTGKTNYLPIGTALRQSFLISVGLLGILLLQTARVLNWLDGILLILAVVLIELYFKK